MRGRQTWSREVFVSYFVTLRREEIDWPGLRAATVAIGIRRAARQAAQDLPPHEKERFVERAMKRCPREKWLIKSQQDKADALATSSAALSANVRKGQEQDATISQLKTELAEQQKEIKALSAQIQKVSAQLAAASPSFGGLEASKFATGRIRRGGPALHPIVNNP